MITPPSHNLHPPSVPSSPLKDPDDYDSITALELEVADLRRQRTALQAAAAQQALCMVALETMAAAQTAELARTTESQTALCSSWQEDLDRAEADLRASSLLLRRERVAHDKAVRTLSLQVTGAGRH